MSNHLFSILQQAGVSVQYGHQRLLAKLSVGPVVVADAGRSAYQISIVRGLAVIEAVSAQVPADIMVRLEDSAVVVGRQETQQPPCEPKFSPATLAQCSDKPRSSDTSTSRTLKFENMSRVELDRLFRIDPSELKPFHE